MCVDKGLCRNGECVPFCEAELNLQPCACNGDFYFFQQHLKMSEICWISLETLTDYRGNQMEEYLDKQKSMSLERNDKITDEFFFFGFTAGSNILRIKGTVWISLDILSIYLGYKWITVLNIFLNASCVDHLFCFQILSTPVKCAAGVKMAPALPPLKVATFYSFAKENPAPWASVMKAWVTKPLYFSALQSRNLLILSYFCISELH